ncbi:MAG: COX15/CtaA family protein, partial [Alphaproteobacteria bacterium]|nr:COX15/CtaA family protein [Alphaproteobacteria bacterium]
ADRPDVSAARLAVHLGMALLIFALLVWTVLDRIHPRAGARPLSAWLLLGLVAAAIASGALVAGNSGGLIYNSFPLMGGELVPPDYRSDRSWAADALENPVAAQLHHRLLAMAALLAVVAAWLRAGGRRAATAEHLLLAAALLQAGLGLAALLAVVPLGLAALHQFGAVLLLAAALLRTHGAIVPASIEFGNTDNRSTIQ